MLMKLTPGGMAHQTLAHGIVSRHPGWESVELGFRLIPGHFHLQLSEQEVYRDQFDFVPAPLWSTSARVEMRPGAPRARGSGCR